MDLVHNDVGDVTKVWLPLKPSEEDPSCAEDQSRPLADLALQSDLITYYFPRFFYSLLWSGMNYIVSIIYL